MPELTHNLLGEKCGQVNHGNAYTCVKYVLILPSHGAEILCSSLRSLSFGP